VASRENLQAIAEIAQKRDLLVISDEVYEKIVYDNNKNFSIGAFPEMDQRTVTINGFSKAYAMTGWRIGYVKGPKIIINKILEMHNHFTICTNAISQKAALAALLGPQDFLNTMLKQYDRRRRFLVKQLNEIPGVSCQMPKGAFYVFPNIKSYKKTSVDIAKYIAQRGRVLVVPGSAFGANGEGHIRLSYATSMKNIRSAVQKIKRTLEEPPK
jgi:aspartate/methionine/tyrosine aminotransferase